MKVLCIVSLIVAVAAAQSGDEEPSVPEISEVRGRPEHPQHPVQPSKAPWLSHRPSQKPGKGPNKQSFNPDDAESFRPQSLRGRGRGNPSKKHNKAFSPIFKVNNVTFQNTTSVQLKEGDNVFFLMQEIRPPFKQYLKLKYNFTELNKVSMEFGELEPPSRVFSPVFKIDNVTFQNTTSVQLKEGDNLFLKVKCKGPRHPHHFKSKRHGPQIAQQYVKLTYNSTEPNHVSVEYGALKPISHGESFGELYEPDSESEEEEY